MLVVQNIISAFGFTACDQFAAYDDAAFGKRDFATNLASSSQPALIKFGVMNLAQMSASLSPFLVILNLRVDYLRQGVELAAMVKQLPHKIKPY